MRSAHGGSRTGRPSTAGPAPDRASKGVDTRTVSFARPRLWLTDPLAGSSSESMHPLVLRLRGPWTRTGCTGRPPPSWTGTRCCARFAAVDGETIHVVDAPAGIALDHAEVSGPDERYERYLARPVDLAVQHPVRAASHASPPDEHLQLAEEHHIAVDGWSWSYCWMNSTGLRQRAVRPGPGTPRYGGRKAAGVEERSGRKPVRPAGRRCRCRLPRPRRSACPKRRSPGASAG